MEWGAPFKKAWSGATQAAKNAATAVSNYAGAAYQRTAQSMSPAQMAMHPQQALIQFSAELARPPAEYAADAAKRGAIATKDAAVAGYNTTKDAAVYGYNVAKDTAVDAYHTTKDTAVGAYNYTKDTVTDAYAHTKSEVSKKLVEIKEGAIKRADEYWGNTVVPAREQQIRDAYGTAHENLSDCPAGSPVNGCPRKQAECQRLKKAREDAILSEHVYMDQPDVDIRKNQEGIDRYDRTTEWLKSTRFRPLDINNEQDRAKLIELGLDDPKALLEPSNSSFRARVYERDNEYVIAYRGTQTAADWGTNFKNGSGLKSHHYTQSADIAKSLKRAGRGRACFADSISFTGHSLAGGLASHSAYLSGLPATTHNSAGLNMNIVKDADPAKVGPVDAYFNAADPLNAAQDNRKEILGRATLAASPWPTVQAALASWLGVNELKGTPVMPKAYGTRRPLPLPENNKNPGPLEGHSMPLLIEGIEIQMAQLGC
jgi:hypothetical protein